MAARRGPRLQKRLPGGMAHGGYGWIPDLPDHRDLLFSPDPAAYRKLATITQIDLSKQAAMPPVWNQGQLGSCTAHAVGVCYAFAHRKSKARRRALDPSRLWIYYQERVLIGTVNEDSGAYIRDGFKVAVKLGVAPEKDWPYRIETFQGPPSARAASDALLHQGLVYRAVPQDLTSLKVALLGGFPVAFGFTVYESFESSAVARTGEVPLPGLGEKALGGHAVALVGFDDPSERFIGRNSWGKGWGKGGYFTMPYSMVTNSNLADDFWTLTLTE